MAVASAYALSRCTPISFSDRAALVVLTSASRCVRSMNALGNLVISLVMSACSVYLISRIAGIVWGKPRLHPRLLTALEMGSTPIVSARRWSSTDLWILVVIEGLIAAAMVRSVADAWGEGDMLAAITFGAHFFLIALWLIYLRTTYRRHLPG